MSETIKDGDSMVRSSTALMEWLQLSERSDLPLYRQVYTEIRNAVLRGQLLPGERLPASRGLSKRLAVSRNTVQQAYDQLIADGLLEARSGAGTRVTRRLADSAATKSERPGAILDAEVDHDELAPIDLGPPEPANTAFAPGIPAFDTFPRGTWAKLLRRHALRRDRYVQDYAHPGGYRPLKMAIARYLAGSRGVICDPEQIIVVTSARAATVLVATVRNAPGANAVVEDPGYFSARCCLAQAGLKITPVPVDRHGIRVADLVDRNVSAAIAYVTPAHQWPLCVALPIERRIALIRWAERQRAWVIEDDYDSEFSIGQPVTALTSLSQSQSVLLVGTFAKTMLPSIRCAYVVVPSTFVKTFQDTAYFSGCEPALHIQAALSDFMKEGHFTSYIQKMRKVYARRRQCLIDSLERCFGRDFRVRTGAGGLQCVVDLGGDYLAREVTLAAARANIVARSIDEYHINTPAGNQLHLGFAATPEAKITASAERLADAFGR